MVPPSGNTTFDVVFLARQLGIVENTLYIHTSQGSFKYQVSAFDVILINDSFAHYKEVKKSYD